jgi:hypothetical protein
VKSFSKNLGINLDITTICTLKCPACFRQTELFPSQKHLYSEMSMEDYFKIANYFKRIEFCGTIGDPIFHKNFIEMLSIAFDKNIEVEIATSASHKNIEWYKKAFNAHKNAQWVFGLDGLPSTSHNYRINQDGEKLFRVMTLAREAGLDVEWQYLIFNYNEKDIDTAKKMAQDIDVRFTVWKTKRHGKGLIPSKEYLNDVSSNIGASSITPRCLNGRDLGHSAMGYITPCCWFGDVNVEEKYPDLCNKDTKIENVSNIEEIFEHPGWKKYEYFLTSDQDKAYPICWNKCGTGYKPSKVIK